MFVVAAMGSFSYMSTLQSLDLAHSLAQTNETLTALKKLLSTLEGAETGQRGFIITDDVTYLEPYLDAIETIYPQIINLQNILPKDNKNQLKFKSLERNINYKIDELKESIKLYSRGEKQNALKIIKEGRGKRFMDKVRSIIIEFEDKQDILLKKTIEEANKSAFITKIVIISGSIFAFIISILSAIGMSKSLKYISISRNKLDIYTKKLELSNKEMKQFTVIISHDLQEPLRKIQTFSDKIINNKMSKLTFEEAKLLDKIQSAASLMRNLLDAILFYFMITKKASVFNSVSIKEIMNKVILDLGPKISVSNAHIELHDLPTIEADIGQMYQLFKQIIENSLKFRKNNENIVIKIYENVLKLEDQTFCEICIEDNGIGFDEKYLEKLFTVFQRLHSRSEFEGNGMGLAICKKIVDYHGGFIKAKSTVGKGALFVITLPFKQVKTDDFAGEII